MATFAAAALLVGIGANAGSYAGSDTELKQDTLKTEERVPEHSIVDEVIWVVGDQPILKSDVEMMKLQGEMEGMTWNGDNNSIRENVTISRGTASKGKTVVGSNNLLMENMHVGHDCVLGSGLIIGNSTKLAGEVVIDDNAILSGCVLVHQFCHIGGYVMVQGGSRSPMDIPPYIIAGRDPLKYCGLNIVGLRRRGFSKEQIDLIHNTYRLLYNTGTLKEGIEEVRKTLPMTKEVEYILNFVETSQRGIIR